MPYVRYTGDHDAIEIPSLGLLVARGDAVEVPDHVADELAAREDWENAGDVSDPDNPENQPENTPANDPIDETPDFPVEDGV